MLRRPPETWSVHETATWLWMPPEHGGAGMPDLAPKLVAGCIDGHLLLNQIGETELKVSLGMRDAQQRQRLLQAVQVSSSPAGQFSSVGLVFRRVCMVQHADQLAKLRHSWASAHDGWLPPSSRLSGQTHPHLRRACASRLQPSRQGRCSCPSPCTPPSQCSPRHGSACSKACPCPEGGSVCLGTGTSLMAQWWRDGMPSPQATLEPRQAHSHLQLQAQQQQQVQPKHHP